MQYEMNVTNMFTTNQRRLDSRWDQKGKTKQYGAVTCGKTTSDLMITHPSKVFALHAELIALWFSTDMHLHTNAIVTNLSICPFSHGRKQCEFYKNLEGYCYGSCQELQHKTPSITSNSVNTGGSSTWLFHYFPVQKLHKGHRGCHTAALSSKELNT